MAFAIAVRHHCGQLVSDPVILAPTLKNTYSELASYADVVRDYRDTRPPSTDDPMAWFAPPGLDLTKVIERSCLSRLRNGKLYPHQQRPFSVWRGAPRQAAERLIPRAGELAAVRSFDQLYGLIRAALRGVSGVGPLTCYDIACRIGRRSQPRVEPAEIYLHGGTTMGAKALGLRVDRDSIPVSELPRDLQCLTATEAEDVLCIYKDALGTIARGQNERPKEGRRRRSRRVPRQQSA